MNRSHFEDVMDKLRQEQEVPDIVWERLEEALDNLPRRRRHSGIRIWRKTAAAAAAFLVVCAIVCYSNPVFASKIPIIGKIFEGIQQEIPFSGDYGKRAQQLLGTDTKAAQEESADLQTKQTASDGGIQVTASEIYCDGMSVFVAAQVYVEQGGLQNIPAHSVIGRDAMSYMLYLRGNWRLVGDGEARALTAYPMEGKVMDDHTFAGMLKLDLEGYRQGQGILALELSGIGWDDTAVENITDIAETHQVGGNWNLQIPFGVDPDVVGEIAVDQARGGYAIQKLFVSPYQVAVYVDAPVTHVEKEISRKDYEEKLGLPEGEEAADLSFADYVALQTTRRQECETVVCNQEGRLLSFGDMSTTQGKTTFAVNGLAISTLHVYVFAGDADCVKADGTLDMDAAQRMAVVSAVVEIP